MRELVALLALALGAAAADFPQAEISNGVIHARLYLPDAERGYYRGTRFDWSGVIPSLTYQGHEYFGQWFERYDPKLHDAIMGPVEEFRSPEGGPGYREAKPGETFLRIGVGAVRKPENRAYEVFRTYDIVDPGKWTIHRKRDRVEFTHKVRIPAGYAYSYRKLVRLEKNKPALVLEHSLRNTGSKPLVTSVYDHNFFAIDGQPTGPDAVVKFPFELKATRDLGGRAEVRGRELVYLQELQHGQTVATELTGFSPSASDYDIRIENRKAHAGVRIVGDHPIERVYYWSIRTTLCPEPYIAVHAEPGQEVKWKIRYEFYTVPQ